MAAPRITALNHVGIVTADVDRAVRIWADRYGVGPWQTFVWDGDGLGDPETGKAAGIGVRIALGQLADGFLIELIEPLDERSVYAESLRANDGRDHVHHLKFDVADYAEGRAALVAGGAEVVADATFAGADPDGPVCQGTYFATEADLGFVTELSDLPAGWDLPAAVDVYPPTGEEGA